MIHRILRHWVGVVLKQGKEAVVKIPLKVFVTVALCYLLSKDLILPLQIERNFADCSPID